MNGFKVDFYWPDLGLVVETDGLRYNRTPAQQGRDRIRDQAHTAAGLTQLRFTHAQVRYEPGHVSATLARTARRLHADRSAADHQRIPGQSRVAPCRTGDHEPCDRQGDCPPGAITADDDACGSAYLMFSMTVPWNRYGSCNTMPNCSR